MGNHTNFALFARLAALPSSDASASLLVARLQNARAGVGGSINLSGTASSTAAISDYGRQASLTNGGRPEMDSDLRAIQRQRRQSHRCVRCGSASGRATLCRECGCRWRYCATCENVYPLTEAYQRKTDDGRTVERCRACRHALFAATYPNRRPWGSGHRLLPEIIKLYRRGKTTPEMAARLGMSLSAVQSIIKNERRRGNWPAALWRGKGWRRLAQGVSDGREGV